MGNSINNTRILDVNMQTSPPASASLDVRTTGGPPSHLSYHSEFEVNLMGIGISHCVRSPKCFSAVSFAPTPSIDNQRSRLELSFAARREWVQSSNNVQCNDGDLFLALFDSNGEELGRTEVFVNCSGLEVSWSKKIPVDFCFGANPSLVFRIYDVNQASGGSPVERQTLLTEGQFNVSRVVLPKNKTREILVQNKKTTWKIFVQAEETEESRAYALNVKYCPAPSQKRKLRGREGQFLNLYKNGDETPIFVTKVVENDNPVWHIPLTRDQIDNKDDNLVIQGYTVSNNGKANEFGKLKASVSDLESGKKADGLSAELLKSPSFLDYLSVCKLECMVAAQISGKKVLPRSLPHSASSSNLIPLEEVMKNVVTALEPYMSDQHYNAWGFGRTLSSDEEKTSCFNLTLKPDKPKVHQVQGLMQAFQSASVDMAVLDGDASKSLSEVIKKASDSVETYKCYNNYYILVIVMDGFFFNFQEAIDSLVYASKQPMSILIVYVGDSPSFKSLKNRCADDDALRDTVLCFEKCKLSADEFGMTETLLKEIPRQFCAYMQKGGSNP